MRQETICPLTGAGCRHASDEHERQIRYFSDLKTGNRGKKVVYVGKGVFCNNDGKTYAKDLKVCPSTILPERTWTPYAPNELEWARRRAV